MKKAIKIGHLNIQSATNKIDELNLFLAENSIDIMLLNETFLTPSKKPVVHIAHVIMVTTVRH